MVQISLLKLSKDECYPATVLDQFSHFVIGSVEDIFPCYHKISDSIIKFNGNSEKFLSAFYAAVSLNDVFPLLSNECKLLLGFEVANHLLAYLVEKLVDLKNRGGLWKVNLSTVAIFSIAECYFESYTRKFTSKFDVPELVSTLMTMHLSDNSMRAHSELFVHKDIALKLLEDMLYSLSSNLFSCLRQK